MQPTTEQAQQFPSHFARMLYIKGAPQNITIGLLKGGPPHGRKSFKVAEGFVPIDPRDAPLLADIYENGEPSYRGGTGRKLFEVCDGPTALAKAHREHNERILQASGQAGSYNLLMQAAGMGAPAPSGFLGSSVPVTPPPAPPPVSAYQPPPGYKLVPDTQAAPQAAPVVAPAPAAQPPFQPAFAPAPPAAVASAPLPPPPAPPADQVTQPAAPTAAAAQPGVAAAPAQKLGRRKGNSTGHRGGGSPENG